MRRWTRAGLLIFVPAGLGILQTPGAARAGYDERQSISVAFGRGLNTNKPMNPVNHAMVPSEVKIDHDGVVHFLVAGFHQVVVYKPGTQPEDITTGSGLFINDPNNQYYVGINPAGGPLGTAPTPVAGGDVRSNAVNRVESVSCSPLQPCAHPVGGPERDEYAGAVG